MKERSGSDKTFNEKIGNYDTIYILGRSHIMMEGCKRIIRCDENSVILLGDREINITGNCLRLKQLGGSVVGVDGIIEKIEFPGK